MYEMLTSKRPFERATPMKSLAAVIREEPASVIELNPQVPSPLRWILERCLAKSPDSRYGSTRELASDLALVRDHFSEAPVKMRRTPPAALPEPLTPLVGRETEIGSLRDLFRQGSRLVTLTGTGGSGKTRLALEIARELDNEFPGGVYFLMLAAVTDPELVISTIAQAFGVWPEPGKPTAQSVREQLGCSLESRTLLVLDNFEQVLEAAPFIGELLTSSGRLNVLVTSRESLHIYGEQEFPVPPLPVPDCGSPPSLERISDYPAIVLFTQRAKAAKRNFALTNENVMAVAQLCARLDGLPLAIELAAPGMKLFTPAVLLARLEDPLHVVARASSDVPVRHQTLRRAIEWSYNLLQADEQKLFRRLSVFVNGCTLEAAEAVCAAYEDLGIDLFEGLASLIDKSLVQQSEQAGAEARFAMLETIRAYAVEQLRSSGEEAAILRAHAAYCLLLAEDGSKELVATVPDASWLTRFDLEHSNFQKAMEWLAEAGNAEWGMRLGVALTRFWELREHFAEGRAHTTRILELPAARVRSKTRARALFAAGFFATTPDIHIAQKTEALDIYRELGDKQGMLVTLNALGVVHCAQGDYAAARTRFEESLSIAKELDDRFALSHALINLGNALGLAGDVSLARSLFKQSMDLFRELGDCAGIASALDHLGDLALDQGDYSGAENLYEEATSLFRGIGDEWGVAHSLKSLGNAARDRGDYAKAEYFYKEGLNIFREMRRTLSMAQVLEAFVCCAAVEHKWTSALTLAGAAAALRRTVGTPLPLQEKLLLEAALESARQETGHRLAASCWNEGWAMLPDAAIDYALGI
jgi:predicted ATPase